MLYYTIVIYFLYKLNYENLPGTHTIRPTSRIYGSLRCIQAPITFRARRNELMMSTMLQLAFLKGPDICFLIAKIT